MTCFRELVIIHPTQSLFILFEKKPRSFIHGFQQWRNNDAFFPRHENQYEIVLISPKAAQYTFTIDFFRWFIVLNRPLAHPWAEISLRKKLFSGTFPAFWISASHWSDRAFKSQRSKEQKVSRVTNYLSATIHLFDIGGFSDVDKRAKSYSNLNTTKSRTMRTLVVVNNI